VTVTCTNFGENARIRARICVSRADLYRNIQSMENANECKQLATCPTCWASSKFQQVAENLENLVLLEY